MRSLSPDEQALWERVAATIRPLSRDRKSAADRAIEPPGEDYSAKRHRPAGRAPARTNPPPPPRKMEALSAKTLDSTWDRRLRSGDIRPDRVIDLHGKNLDGAWTAIDLGLERAVAANERVILLITGHSRRGDPPVQRGKIRAAVHDWLEASRHASGIAAVRGAHARHGGGGSLYIILRRDRPKSTLS